MTRREYNIKKVLITSISLPVLLSSISLAGYAADKKPTKEFDILKPGKVVIETYKTKKGENLKKIAASQGVSVKQLKMLNGIKNADEGKVLPMNKIINISKYTAPGNNYDGIIVNVPEQKLYFFYKGSLNETYKVSVGTPGKWQTPLGDYKIVYKDKAPVWKVPVSIQKEMAAKGQVVKKEVPAGPDNPLGNWWMGLDRGGIGIHSTNAPASIGYSVTHGCVRMNPSSAAELFNKVKTNIPVRIVYQPIKINFNDKKHVYLEVFPDNYDINVKSENTVKTLLKKYDIDENTIDFKKVQEVAKAKNGIPVMINKSV